MIPSLQVGLGLAVLQVPLVRQERPASMGKQEPQGQQELEDQQAQLGQRETEE